MNSDNIAFIAFLSEPMRSIERVKTPRLCDEPYHPEDEGGIMWNDHVDGIERPDIGWILLSEKDKKHLLLRDAK